MPLLNLWKDNPEQIASKHLSQLIGFAGDGKLKDDSDCSRELREYLASVPSKRLAIYAEHCLTEPFVDSGLALQDVVNETGRRLGAKATPGRYRGTTKQVGFDGLWRFPSGHTIVIEVKTTDAYRISLDTIASYRAALVASNEMSESQSSMLLIVGRQDTGDLEAQIRGSRHAWELRVISVDALFRLLAIKEDVEDPANISRIHNILIPREFTRLDEIANLLFVAAEDIKADSETTEVNSVLSLHADAHVGPLFTPVSFHEACIARVEELVGKPLLKLSRAKFVSSDKRTHVNCMVSKEHDGSAPNYWFAFHPHQAEFLKEVENSFVVLGCGSEKYVLMIPFTTLEPWLEGTWVTKKDDRFYWHLVVDRRDRSFSLRCRKGQPLIDLNEFLMPIPS